jgi:hypothetical protein
MSRWKSEVKFHTKRERAYPRRKSTDMKFMRHTAGYSSLDRRRNEDILEELKVDPV